MKIFKSKNKNYYQSWVITSTQLHSPNDIADNGRGGSCKPQKILTH